MEGITGISTRLSPVMMVLVMLLLIIQVQANDPSPASSPSPSPLSPLHHLSPQYQQDIKKFDLGCYMKWARHCRIYLSSKEYPGGTFKSFERCLEAIKIHCAREVYRDFVYRRDSSPL